MGFVLVRVDDDGVEKVTAALLHLTGFLDDLPQVLRLHATQSTRFRDVKTDDIQREMWTEGDLGVLVVLGEQSSKSLLVRGRDEDDVRLQVGAPQHLQSLKERRKQNPSLMGLMGASPLVVV